MDTEDLIRRVTAEVLKRIQEAKCLPCVLVLGARDESFCARVRSALKDGYPNGLDIFFDGECLSGRVPEHYIVPQMSCSDMADIAMGKASTPQAKSILDLLLAGMEVEVAEFAYRRYTESAPLPLLQLYEGYLKTLSSFGVREFRPYVHKIRTTNMLITAADVEKAAQNGAKTMEIHGKANVTALAEDTAAANGITIVRERKNV